MNTGEKAMYNLYQLTPVEQILNVKTNEWYDERGESTYQWVEDSCIGKFMDWFDENYNGELRKIMRVSRGQMQQVIDISGLDSNL